MALGILHNSPKIINTHEMIQHNCNNTLLVIFSLDMLHIFMHVVIDRSMHIGVYETAAQICAS